MPSAPRSLHNFAAETSSLLKESLSTNSLASQENLRDDLEVQIQSIHDKVKIGKADSRYKLTLLLSFLGSLSTVLILGVLFFRSTPIDTTSEEIDAVSTDAVFPFSLVDPVIDMNLAEVKRSRDEPAFPSYYYGGKSTTETSDRPRKGLPTNAWYQNMLQAPANDEPSNVQRAYTGPYLVDVVGTIPGLRIHANDILASDMVMQLSFNEGFGLVLGGANSILSATKDGNGEGSSTTYSHKYKVVKTTDLGITLEWEEMNMASNLVKGMAYVTMEYEKQKNDSSNFLLPTIGSVSALHNSVVVDGAKTTLDCSKKIKVQKDIELFYPESDYTWMVFFSEPVWIQCSMDDSKSLLQVVEYDAYDICASRSDTLVVRVALIDQCTNGWNALSCRKGLGTRLPDEPNKDEYIKLLRSHVDKYPGRDTSFSYVITSEDDEDKAELIFDWDAKSMLDLSTNWCPWDADTGADLLSFAIPHQMDHLSNALPNEKRYCKSTITGPACLVEGNQWKIPQVLPSISFTAKRPPKPHYIPTLATALSDDIGFKIPGYFKRGAGDTYFSGKILAKLARVLLITEEVGSLCGEQGTQDYLQFCKNSTLPVKEQIEEGLRELREGVEVWINGTAETPLLYDASWGGVVSCGCTMRDDQCTNKFPNCPGLSDPGLNFGNGFYNDHHFHYGYHIFAASVVAHFDRVWGMDNFESVLMLVRDIANPSEKDTYFPTFRHKDWYMGSSWASGITYPAYLNGKNQESSSEAIAAYEGVALYGQVMNKIWAEEKKERHAAISKQIANVGKLMTGTELVSAKRYYHIPEDASGNDARRIYPAEYNKPVVGILWQTMAQFSTWFGAKEYLPIGIQLLPLTPISEDRDDVEWANLIYQPLTYSCAIDFECTESGWSILQLAILATVGHPTEAVMKVKELPDEAFTNAGGNGNSRSNSIWYIATRPEVQDPIPLLEYDERGEKEVHPTVLYELKDCYVPDTCTDEVLDRVVGDYTCRVRMSWLIYEQNLPQWEACWKVAGLEFPEICGPCDPGANFVSKEQQREDALREEEEKEKEKQESMEQAIMGGDSINPLSCPPCTEQECNSDLNRCPVYKRSFVCTEGTSKGGCSGEFEWWVLEDQCDACCEMTNCFDLKDNEAKRFTKDGNALSKSNCPACKPEICYGKLNQCPIHSAPYLCTEGPSVGGCASRPWAISDVGCSDCCELKLDC